MSVSVAVNGTGDGSRAYAFPNVIGHVLAMVVKQPDGGITLERDIAVNADNAEDNQLAEQVVKDLQAKFEELFPNPNKPQPSKIWVPE